MAKTKNDQNTVAGTGAGGRITPEVGNPIVDAFGWLSNVATSALDSAGSVVSKYGSFLETKNAVSAAQQAQNVEPQETIPWWLASSPLDLFSDPDKQKKLALAAGVIVAVGVGYWYLFKRN